MTKSVFLLSLCILFFIGCKEKKYGAFAVSGIATNALPKSKVWLIHLPYGGVQGIVVDSTSVSRDKTFILRGMAREEAIYAVAVEGNEPVLIINDNKTIQLRCDSTNYYTPNSTASTALHNFLNQYNSLYLPLDSLLTILTTITTHDNEGNDDLSALHNNIENKRRQIINTIAATLKSTNSPALSYFLLAKTTVNAMQLQSEVIATMVEAATKKFPDHMGIAFFKTTIVPNTTVAEQYDLIDQLAPPIALWDTRHNRVQLRDFRGQYVLLDFWASWCAPCKAVHQTLDRLYKKYKNNNFTIIGISFDHNKKDWMTAIENERLQWQQLSDLQNWQSDVRINYHLSSIPCNVLIDPNGKIIAYNLVGEHLNNKIKKLLQQ